MDQKIILRQLKKEDLQKIAFVHLKAFPDSALTKLGSDVVIRYYQGLLSGPYLCYAIGSFNESQLIGFSFAGEFQGSTSNFLKNNKKLLVKKVLLKPWLVFNSLILDRMLLSIKLLKKISKKVTVPKNQVSHPTSPQKSLGILSIAVVPEMQNHGIGRTLLISSEDYAKTLGYNTIYLTVHTDNIPSVIFYENNGYKRVLSEGNWRGLMHKELKTNN